MISLANMQSKDDHGLFIKHSKERKPLLIVYVNDMIIAGDEKVKNILHMLRIRDEEECLQY